MYYIQVHDDVGILFVCGLTRFYIQHFSRQHWLDRETERRVTTVCVSRLQLAKEIKVIINSFRWGRLFVELFL